MNPSMSFINNYSSVASNEMNFPFVNINNGVTDSAVFIPESKYIEAQIDGLRFQILKTTSEGGQVILSVIGKDGRECAEIKFNHTDPEKELLAGLSYKSNCRIGGEMSRGEQTIKMIKALILYAFQSYPEFEYVGFMDKSERQCDSSEKIDLADYSFWVYGETWYQKNFMAIPDPFDTGLLDGMSAIHTVLDSKISEDISSIFLRTGDGFPSSHMKNDFLFLYEKEKKNGNTWRSFLNMVFSKESKFSQKYGSSMTCAFFNYIYDKLANKLGIRFRMSGTLWRIPVDVAHAYPEHSSIVFKEVDPIHIRVKRGGLRNTRKKKSVVSGYGGIWRTTSIGKHHTRKSYMVR
jgi:hypothetical protein